MRRSRIYFVSVSAGLAGAIAILWISSRIERQQAQHYFERMRDYHPVDRNFQGGGGVVGSPVFGPGIFTVFLAVLAFYLVYRLLLRWQDR